MLAEPVLMELGLLEKANRIANSGDAFSLLTDRLMATGVYRPGTNVEGTVISDEELPALLGVWLAGLRAESSSAHPRHRRRRPASPWLSCGPTRRGS